MTRIRPAVSNLAFQCIIAMMIVACAHTQSQSPVVQNAPGACTSLATIEITPREIGLPTNGASITSVEFVTTDSENNINGEFCKVIGAIHPVSHQAPDIIFEVNLPTRWNGKTLHYGGGGFNGKLVTGLEHYKKQPEAEPTPLARGYVTYGSDSGHQSSEDFDGSFLLNDEALRNYGREQIKKTHDVAQYLVLNHYGSSPRYKYFTGGSQGGHEGFDVVQSYPDDYHGVVAGYPAHNVVMLHLSANRYAKTLLANEGAGWLNPQEVSAFTSAIYAVCDGLDNAEDGIISNTSACRNETVEFKLHTEANPVRCPGGGDTADNCLSDAQIETLNVLDSEYDLGFSIFADDEGNSVFPKWTPFEGSTFYDGDEWNLGEHGPDQAKQVEPGVATPRYMITQDLTLDALNDFDPFRYAGRITDLAELISANSVNLDRFRDRGGKLIFYHGMIDDYIPVYSSIEYFERLLKKYGPEALEEFVRFYTVPGMGHRTGVFNAQISTLDALESWVEQGTPPGELVATDANDATMGRTRPVCRYPAWPRYTGSGSLDEAASFRCVLSD